MLLPGRNTLSMNTKRCLYTIIYICVALIFPLVSVASPQERPPADVLKSAVVARVTSDITVDGILEESDWQTAPTIGELTQREPQPGTAPTEKTEVRLLRDAANLYIGVMCYDSEPDRVVSTQMVRDGQFGSDDRIQIVLDTYRDQRNAFYFATNPAGVLVDGLLFANGQSNMNWDAIWNVRARRTAQGWSAEFAIPFKSLSFPGGSRPWGFNFARHIQRKLEEDRWSGARLQTEFFQVSEAGEITNLEGLTQGTGVDVRPFVGGKWLYTKADGNSVITGKPGLDMFYNLTPSLKLTLTANTDFGETEVDARQINLSRFSLLFPEKRAFFLEDAGVFNFSNTAVRAPAFLYPNRSDIIPFFSRSIGLLGGEEVPIDVGTKLTGKVGRTDLGILDVRTRGITATPDKNFFVGRVKRNLLQQSHIGAIFTNGNPASTRSSSTYGVDLRLATSQFLGKSNLIFNAYGVRSANEGVSARDISYGYSLEYPNDVIELDVLQRVIPQNFRPALGFVGRRNVRAFRAGAKWGPRPGFLNLQQMFEGVYYNRYTRLDNGQIESWNVGFIGPVDFHFKSGDSFHSLFTPDIQYERLLSPFELYPGLILPPGEYRFTRWKNNFATAGKRNLQGMFEWVMGSYWSGHADELRVTLTYKLPPRLTVTVQNNHTFARLPEKNFVARIFTSTVNYTASPLLTFANLIQYDNVSRNLGWQSRVRWILEPGNDLFFVFGQSWLQDPAGGYQFTTQDTKISAKLQYTFRF
jgi:hypothetical protein